MGIKEKAIQLIETLPDDVSMDQIMQELYFKIQVDAGLEELDAGKGIPHEKVEQRLGKWLSK